MWMAWIARAPVISRALLLLFIAAWGIAQEAVAQINQAPTPAQLEAFGNLPPDQQQAVLEAMSGSSTENVSDIQAPPGNNASVVRPKPTDLVIPKGPPRTQAGSTLILTVDVDSGSSHGSTRRILDERRAQIRNGNPFRLTMKHESICHFSRRSLLEVLLTMKLDSD